MELTGENVTSVLTDCMLTEQEAEDHNVKKGDDKTRIAKLKGLEDIVVLAGAITATFGFNRERLEGHREDVKSMLEQLPANFHKDTGGGWSFLNMCLREDGTQWTGEHRVQEALCSLAIALGLGYWLLPQEMWFVFPAGLPYFCVGEPPEENITPR